MLIKTLLECKRCGYVWQPRSKVIYICPNCKSKYWNEEKTELECFVCGHRWRQKSLQLPKYCPNCHCANWNVPEAIELVKATRELEEFLRTGSWEEKSM